MGLQNYSILKILVLEEILGNSTTQEISQKMGFKFDKFKRWMKHEKILKWDEFEILCRSLHLDLESAYEIFKIPIENKEQKEEKNTKNFFSTLKEIHSFESNQALANHLNCHVSVIKRYSKGDTSPDIETVFRIMGIKTIMLSNFLKRLFSNNIHHPLLTSWVEQDMKLALFLTFY